MRLIRLLNVLAVLGLAMLMGCSSVPEPARVPLARLMVHNLTGYEWRVTVAPAGGGEPVVSHVAARQTATIELAGGDYVIEQVVLSTKADADLIRRLPARFSAGKIYEWELVTLFSEPGESTSSVGARP